MHDGDSSQGIDAMGRPRLLCIEGPAGSGKTTLCGALAQTCSAAGIDFSLLGEFSATPLGQELSGRLARFSQTPVTWSPMETMMLCIADKLAALASVHRINAGVILLDRGFITQSVLTILFVNDEACRRLSKSIVSLLNAWLAARFGVTTFVLQLPMVDNVVRLEARLGRDITDPEKKVLQLEIDRYAALATLADAGRLGLRLLDAKCTPEALADKLMSIYFIRK